MHSRVEIRDHDGLTPGTIEMRRDEHGETKWHFAQTLAVGPRETAAPVPLRAAASWVWLRLTHEPLTRLAGLTAMLRTGLLVHAERRVPWRSSSTI
jgi:hypothetical protein